MISRLTRWAMVLTSVTLLLGSTGCFLSGMDNPGGAILISSVAVGVAFLISAVVGAFN